MYISEREDCKVDDKVKPEEHDGKGHVTPETRSEDESADEVCVKFLFYFISAPAL